MKKVVMFARFIAAFMLLFSLSFLVCNNPSDALLICCCGGVLVASFIGLFD